jgi:two-component system, OmpR family, phosphate regulon sensor histidine kinase PhoR
MKRKIILYFLIVFIIGITITGTFIFWFVQKLYKNEVENGLVNSVNLVKNHIKIMQNSGLDIDYNEQARNLVTSTDILVNNKPISIDNIRITFIDHEGNILGESHANSVEMENHLHRKEMRKALKGDMGKDIRKSRTLGTEFFYVAVPIKNSNVIIRGSVPLTKYKNIQKAIFYYILVGVIIGLIFAIFLVFRFSDYITRPVVKLITATKEMTSGNYTKEVPIKAAGEIGELANSYNIMSKKLSKTITQLQKEYIMIDSIINSISNAIIAVDTDKRIILINRTAFELFNIDKKNKIYGTNIIETIRNAKINNFISFTLEKKTSIVDDINISIPRNMTLKVSTNPIRKKNDDKYWGAIILLQDVTNIRKLEQIRTEFVSNVTHELKTPLTSIRGFIETLRNGAINDPTVSHKFLDIIDVESERLYNLINDVLQLSEIETQEKVVIEKTNFNLVVKEVISVLSGVAEKKGIRMNYKIDGEIYVNANRNWLKQMLINLVDNGIKYNTVNGSINIYTYKDEGKLIISLKDTGIGISKDEIPRIFERFYRVDRVKKKCTDSTGLGLSIVKHIIKLYNGDIKVNSTLGKGTEFIIQLPS